MFDRSNHDRRRSSSLIKDESVVPFKAVNWRRLLGYLKPYRGRMALAILTLLFKALIDLKAGGRILCESPLMEDDALLMVKTYKRLAAKATS